MASTKRPPVQRGEVWIVALDPIIGSEQAKTRPCVIVQRDSANGAAPTTIVVPFTGASIATSIIAPRVPEGDGGLAKDSIALCHQVRVVDRQRMRARLGQLTDSSMQAICAGLETILDLANT